MPHVARSAPLDRGELAAWLRLLHAPGVGLEAARRLLAAFGSPQAVFDARPAGLREVVPPALAQALAAPPSEALVALVETTQAWQAGGEAADGARQIVTLGDIRYPPALLETADPPLLLYAQGRIELLQAPSLAVVGSRNPSAQGLDNARAFAGALGTAGWTVVSGLALGVDGAAHEGALKTAASTVAVVGTGLDRIYPGRHQALARQIARDGLLVSEFALGTPPLRENFPRRNRLIAGLTRGTLVVEAALQSGSLITARLALEAGREVFAIPGSIHSAQSRGCHALIKQGAKLVESVADILVELGAPAAVTAPDPAGSAVDSPAAADPVLDALGHDPSTLDALMARCGWPMPLLQARLLDLELDDRVARLPGGLFQRVGRA